MMIKGVGVDIIEIERIRKAVNRRKVLLKGFLTKVKSQEG